MAQPTDFLLRRRDARQTRKGPAVLVGILHHTIGIPSWRPDNPHPKRKPGIGLSSPINAARIRRAQPSVHRSVLSSVLPISWAMAPSLQPLRPWCCLRRCRYPAESVVPVPPSMVVLVSSTLPVSWTVVPSLSPLHAVSSAQVTMPIAKPSSSMPSPFSGQTRRSSCLLSIDDAPNDTAGDLYNSQQNSCAGLGYSKNSPSRVGP